MLGYFIEADAATCRQAAWRARRATCSAIARPSAARCASRPTNLPTLASRISQAADQALAIERELFDADGGRSDCAARRCWRDRRRLARLDVATGAGRARRRQASCAARKSIESLAFEIRARASSRRRSRACAATMPVLSCRTIAICRATAAAASGSSPARTWPANRPSCARTR